MGEPDKKHQQGLTERHENEDMAAKLTRLEAENRELRRQLGNTAAAPSRPAEKAINNDWQFRSMVENAPDAAYQRNLRTNSYDYLSPIIEDVLGWPLEEMWGADIQSVLRLVHPEDLAGVEQVIRQTEQTCCQNGTATEVLEYRFRDKEGNYRWIRDQITILPDDEGRPLYLLGAVRDISLQKQSQAALLQSEANYQTLFDTMPQGVVYQDREGKIISANPAAERMIGLTIDQMRGLTALDPRWRAVHEDGTNFPGDEHPTQVARRTKSPVVGVPMGVFNPVTERYCWMLVSAIPQFLPGEDDSYQVFASFEDITQRKLMQDALLESETKYSNLFNQHAAVTLLINPDDGRIVDANQAAVDFYGWPKERLTQMRIHQINTLSPEQVTVEIQKAREQQRIQFEFVHRLADGSLRNVEVYSSRIDVNGNTLLHSIIHDITARKRAEKELRKSEERWQSTVDTLPIMVVVADLNARVTYLNPYGQSLLKQLGWPCCDEQPLGLPPMFMPNGALLLPDELPFFKAARMNQVLQNIETILAINTSEELTLIWNAAPLYGAGGELVGGIGVGRDISDLKRADQKLLESNKRLNDILNSMTDIFYAVDADWRFIEVNAEAQEKFFQRPGPELIGKILWECYPQTLGTEIEKRYRQAVAENRPVHFEVHSTIRDAWFEAHAHPRADRLEIYLRDITERKVAEEKVRNIARFPEQSPNPILRIDASGILIYANRASLFLQNTWGFKVSHAVPADWQNLVAQTLSAQKQRVLDMACGEKIYSLTVVPFPEAGCVNVYGQDVTERVNNARALQKAHDELELRVQSRTEELLIANKRLQFEAATRLQTEETLRLVNAYNRSLIETSLDPMMTIGLDGMVSDVNSAAETITGYKRDEIIGTDFYRYFTDPMRAVSVYRDVLIQGTVSDLELEFKHRDGSTRLVDFNASVYRDHSGNIIGVFAAARDISLRKQVEQQILIQTTALESAANGVIITDVNGVILWVNPAVTQISGYEISETIGQNPRIYKSDQTRKEVYQDLWQTILSGNVWRGELINRRKNGELYTEEETITPVLDANGKVSHFIAVIQDITERKRSEIELVRLNRAEKLLSECNTLLIHAEEESSLLFQICRLIIEIGGYRLAWIGYPQQDPEKTVRPVALFGEEAAYISNAHISWGENDRGRGPTGTALREGIVQINQDFKTNRRMELWREMALDAGFQASIALPLKEKQQTLGVLTIYSAIPDAFHPEEAELLTKLAENLSFGISALHERAEREHAQSITRRWMHIFEHAEWGVVIGSSDGRTLELMNPAFARMHGYTAEELVGKPIDFIFAADSKAALPGHIQRAHDLGHYVFEANHIRKDGSTFPVIVDVTTVKDENEQVLYRAVNVQDITERKAAERNIQQQEALLRTVMDNLPVGVWLTDSTGKIIRTNPAGLRVWAGAQHVGPEQFGEYKAWRVDTGEQQTPETWAATRAVKHLESTINEELEIECFDGTHKYILNSAFPLYDEQHRLTNVVIVNQDITEIRSVQNDLIHANELLERAFASVDVMIASMDREFNFLKVNRAFAQMEDQSPEAFVGKNYFDLYPGLEIEHLFRGVVESGETCSVYRQPYRHPLHPERGLVYWDCRIQPVKDPAGKVTGAVLSLADVTERMQAEIALQESVEKYRSLVDSSPDAILLTNLDHKILFASQHALEFFGAMDLQDLLESNVMEFFAPEERSRAEYNAQLTLNRGVTRNIEYSIVKLDGTRFPVELNMAVVRDAQGQPMAFHKVARDITERKQVEKALEIERQHLLTLSQAERNQRLFAESLAEATAALSSSLNLNEVLDRILDLIEQVVPFDAALVSLNDQDMIRIARSRGFVDHPEIIEYFENGVSLDDFPSLKEIVESGKPMILAGSAEDLDIFMLPGWEWVKAYIGIPLQTREQVLGTLNMFFRCPQEVEKEQIDRLTAFANQASVAIQNASLFNELENSLTQEHALRTRLIQSEKFAAMGRLLASVAHELNNPLQTIKNCLFLTRQDCEPDSPVQEYLDMAFSETARLSKLVGQLRELYRPRVENVMKSYVFSKIIEEVHSLLTPHLAQQKVAWLQRSGCEDGCVKCNLDQIKQVLINIAMNGIEAMQPEGGTLEVGLTTSTETNMIGVSFRDSGPGIAPEVLKKLFEPFVTTKSNGLGLGLSICYELIQRHNGQIHVDTQPGQGATFTVWLPLSQESSTP